MPSNLTVAVNGQPSGTYEQTMAIIAGSPRPITITFVDPVGFAGSRGISPFPRHSGLGAPVSGGQSWVRHTIIGGVI